MKVHSLFLLAGVLAVTVACNHEEKSAATAANGQSSELVPVTLTAQTESSTRASGTTLNDTYITSNQSVIVRIAEHGTTQFTDYEYTTGDNGALNLPAENLPYYPTTGSIDIRAYHPASVDQYFSVRSDQSTDAGYIASDLMWSDGVSDVGKSYDPLTLTFAHKLCKIVVTATGVGGVSKIKAITLNQVKPTVNFSTTNGTITGAASGDATNITLLSGGTTRVVTATAIIPAQTINGNLITFTVETESGDDFTAVYQVSNKSFTAGSVNTFNLNVSWAEVSGANAVTPWGDGGSTPGTIFPTLD